MPTISNFNNQQEVNLTLNSDYSNIEVITGSLPDGLIFDSNGNIIGQPLIANVFSFINEYVYNFSISANLKSNSATVIEDYSVCVTKGTPLTRHNITEQIRLLGDKYEIPLYNNTLQTGTWRLASGLLPPGASVSAVGPIVIPAADGIAPFARDRFTDNAIYNDAENILDWDQWFEEFITQTQEFDYSFCLEFVDNNNLVLAAHSFRIVHLTVPASESWFLKYRNNLNYDSTGLYYIIFDTQTESITWTAAANLGTIDNGTVSTLSVSAVSDAGINLSYILRPYTYSRLPQGLAFNYDGDLIGRVSFRSNQDDPANVPINNYYEFYSRAYTPGHRTYSERKFTLTVNPRYNRPRDNIWLYAMTDVANRQKFYAIMDNSELFPEDSLYRPLDDRFGKAKQIKIMFAAGIEAKHISYFESVLVQSHYQKSLTMAQPKLAYALDHNLNIVYETVYLPVIDRITGRSSTETQTVAAPIEIDLRNQIQNYYIKDGRSYYILMPNSLESMRAVLQSSVGANDLDHMPLWMTSVQPGSGPGLFRPPIGFISAVALAYCRPGHGRKILERVSAINFNTIEFSFDRYQLENQLSTYYDFDSNSFITGSNIARFDDGTTIFDSNSTKVLENIEYYYPPESGNKYLKFPRTNIFR